MLAYSQVAGAVPSVRTAPAVTNYLAARGVDLDLATRLRLKILPATDLFAQVNQGAVNPLDNRVAVVFPHYNVRGDLLDWWSARLVAGVLPTPAMHVASFADYITQAQTGTRMGKMFCPPNEPPAAYLPQAAGLPSWQNIPHGARVYLHESVLKAVNGAVLGTYSVGLNGVWGWGSKKHNLVLVPELKDLPWKRLDLQPVIIFDTNINTNQQVQAAASNLAAKLFAVTGRTAKLLRLPKLTDEPDFGFDDFLQREGLAFVKAFLATPDADLEPIDIDEVELLKQQLNVECAVVTTMARVATIADGTLMTVNEFKAANYAHYTVLVDGPNDTLKPVNVPALWLQDVRRTTVATLDYAPGQPAIFNAAGGAKHLNTWYGWGCPPDPTHDAAPWLELLGANVDDEFMREWILDWLAYPVQNPGAKMSSLLLVFGPPGTGKDLFLAPIHKLYGARNSIKISNHQLGSNFTSLYAQKQFIHADELKRARTTADVVNQTIKGMVTNEKMVVNQKGQPEYTINNVSNLAITSNYFDCVKLDEDDRRAAVVRWEPQHHAAINNKDDPDYWARYATWVDTVGPQAIMAFLLQRDLSRFKPKAWAPTSLWKEEVIDAARDTVERFVHQLKVEPDLHLPVMVGARQLFTSKELAVLHYGVDITKGKVDAVGNELRNQNFIRANRGKSIKSTGGAVSLWYVVPRPGLPQLDWQNPTVCSHHLKTHGL